MALTVTSRGTGTHNTGATTLVPGGRSATLAAGSLGVLCIALDNAGSAGSALIAPNSWTDAKGNVWTLRQNALYDNGAASAGIEMAIYTAPITVALLTTDAGTMTWKNSTSPVAKAWTWYEVIPSANAEAVYSTGGTIAGATAANAQVVTASVPVGDAVIAGYFSENVAAVTGDSDSTNGTWTAQQTATVGSTTSGVRIATQQKVQTTTASTQSYDVTVSSQDRIAGYVMLHEQHTGSASVVATGGGVAAAALATARSAAIVDTGGGVLVAARSSARSTSLVDTGGGVASANRTSSRSTSLTQAGGGIATIDYAVVSVENHDATFSAVGGGVASLALVAGRASAPVATGGGVAVESASTQRAGVSAMTGGGAAAITKTSSRSAALAAAGGGVVSQSVLAARYGAALMSGGGALTTAQATARASAPVATGGGILTYLASTGEDHPATFSLTGGGRVSVDPLAARLTSITSAGAGAVAIALQSARIVALAAAGGGIVHLDIDVERPQQDIGGATASIETVRYGGSITASSPSGSVSNGAGGSTIWAPPPISGTIARRP